MKICEWREIVKMPVMLEFYVTWNVNILQDIIFKCIKACVEKNLLDNNGRICTALSGGVDSSLCLAIICLIVDKDVPIHTFTIGKDDKHPDILLARLASKLFNTIHHELIPSVEDIERAKKTINSVWPEEKCSLGDVAVYLTYENINTFGFKSLISHDGIDELMGGYWDHRRQKNNYAQEEVFKFLWRKLKVKHLLPLEKKAKRFGINVIFPYLQKEIVEYISGIPVWHRTTKEESKIPLKDVARNLNLPPEIVDRKKIGFCDALS